QAIDSLLAAEPLPGPSLVAFTVGSPSDDPHRSATACSDTKRPSRLDPLTRVMSKGCGSRRRVAGVLSLGVLSWALLWGLRALPLSHPTTMPPAKEPLQLTTIERPILTETRVSGADSLGDPPDMNPLSKTNPSSSQPPNAPGTARRTLRTVR